MFRRKSEVLNTPAVDFENTKPLTLKLNDNILTFSKKGWISQSSDIDAAANEINVVLDERDALALKLEEALLHFNAMKEEVIEINKTKTVILNMLIEEKEKNAILQHEIDAYKEELRESYKVTMELRKHVTN